MTRRLLILAAFLLAGAVVNVGVAWGCAVSIRLSKPASPPVWAILRGLAPDGSQQGRPSQHQPGRARRAEPELWHIWGIERIKLRGALFFCSFSDARYSRWSGQTSVTEDDIRRFRFPVLKADRIREVLKQLHDEREKLTKLAHDLEKREWKAWDEFKTGVVRGASKPKPGLNVRVARSHLGLKTGG